MRDGWADGGRRCSTRGVLLGPDAALLGPDAAWVEERRGWGVGAVDVGLEDRRGRGRRRRWPEIEQGDEGGGGAGGGEDERAVCVGVGGWVGDDHARGPRVLVSG